MALRLDLPEQTDVSGLRCVRVWIPDSDAYESALHSLLTYPTKWFAWQRDAAHGGAVAASLWRMAYAKTTEDYLSGLRCDDGCEDCTDSTDGNNGEFCPNCGGFTIGLGDLEFSNMPFVTDITCEDGVLYKWYGPCCKIAVECEMLTQPAPDDFDQEGEGSACNKAHGMAVAFVDLVLQGLATGDWDTNSEFISDWVAGVPSVSWLTGYLYQASTSYFAYDTPNDIDDFYLSKDAVGVLSCLWSVILEDTDALTSLEFTAMQTALSSIRLMAGYNTTAVADFTQSVMQAVPFLTWQWWAKTSYANEAGNCDCPYMGPVEASSIYFTGSYTYAGDSGITINEVVAMNGGRRVRIQANVTNGDWRQINGFALALAGAQVDDDVTMRVYPDLSWATQTGWVPEDDWRLTTTLPLADDYHLADLTGQGSGVTTRTSTSGESYREHEFVIDGASTPATGLTFSARFNPQDGGIGGWSVRWFIEVVAVNDTEYSPIGP